MIRIEYIPNLNNNQHSNYIYNNKKKKQIDKSGNNFENYLKDTINHPENSPYK